jgi:regulator of cell morphogenesis and NO signaling
MQDISTMTIRDIAVASPATTRVFEEYKIDYCCGGGKKFADACAAAGVEPAVVSEKITGILDGPVSESEPEQLPVPRLIDHILDTHHVFTRKEMYRLTALMDKVCNKHGAAHPELYQMKDAFALLCNDLFPHMKKEEMVLFPYIQELHNSHERSAAPRIPPFGSVAHPIRMMNIEHDEAGNIMRNMRELSKDYALPDGACPSFGALYFGLDELEKDLHKHIHLENNVLFPQAIELENAVLSTSN